MHFVVSWRCQSWDSFQETLRGGIKPESVVGDADHGVRFDVTSRMGISVNLCDVKAAKVPLMALVGQTFALPKQFKAGAIPRTVPMAPEPVS